MPSYDWRQYRDRGWFERFPQNARGYTLWRQQRFEPRFDLKAQAESMMEAREHATAGPSRPCLFVSHRQADAAQATRIAYLACQEGFDYWLDVLDPTLSGVPSAAAGTTPEQIAAATAAVVEMALLNSSHVLAVITPNTKGSQWVPYEYGRVKTTQITTLQAACWIDHVARVSPIPEYLYLGAILKSESEIRQWLRTELQGHTGRHLGGACSWTSLTPAPL